MILFNIQDPFIFDTDFYKSELLPEKLLITAHLVELVWTDIR